MSTESAVRSELTDAIEQVGLVDHHVHGSHVVELPRTELESALSESGEPIPGWMSQFDSQVGFAVRRWCAPILGLEPHASADAYVARRDALGIDEVSRRFLTQANVDHWLIETGFGGDVIAGVQEMSVLSGSATSEVVRLETELEALAASGSSVDRFADRFVEQLAVRSEEAVGLKSIIAYRFGLDFDPAAPSDREVTAAVERWYHEIEEIGRVRVSDPVLMRFGLWAGVRTGLPIQFHVGYGDADIALHRGDPLLMRDFMINVAAAGTGTTLLLLHCYPYQRQAGYLSQIFPHVFFDVGLGVNYTGARSDALVAESLELAPFAKVLFSSDAWGPPELHYLGARLWRRGMVAAVAPWVEAGEWAFDDAVRVFELVGAENARRVYRLGRE
jgi:predicted TIM-barrel fold metal-dependent hydrolase